MSSGGSGDRFGFAYRTIPIPSPRPIPEPNPIPEPSMINAPNPIPEPFVIPSSTVVSFDFEDMNLVGWTVVDEPPHLLGQPGPSRWEIADGPISGKALAQRSNIWGDKSDVVPLGTFIIYDLVVWEDFIMDFDIYARDNDGVGIVWGWRSRTDHFRFLTMIDPNNPTGAPPDQRGPFSVVQRRTGDEPPYYRTLARVNQASYVENRVNHFRIEVLNRRATIYGNNVMTLHSDRAGGYRGGKIGFVLYAHNEIYFDNVRIESVMPEMFDQNVRFTQSRAQILPR